MVTSKEKHVAIILLSVVSLLRELGGSGQSVRKTVKEVSDEALKSVDLD